MWHYKLRSTHIYPGYKNCDRAKQRNKKSFFSRRTLTEKLIELVPDIDIHIIPDTVQAENYRKRHYEIHWKHPSARDLLLTLLIFTACTVIGLLFEKLHFTDTNVVTIYILGVLLTSVLTDGYFCSLAGSFLSAFLFCFFLTEPGCHFKLMQWDIRLPLPLCCFPP